jgi:arylsulfatase
MKIVGDELQLQFSGDDPGIAIDLRGRQLPVGPYKLAFGLIGGSQNGGAVFYTTDPSTTLPKGERQTFPVQGNEQRQELSVELPTNESLQQLRLDVCDGKGTATIFNLRLIGPNDTVLAAWPERTEVGESR